MIHTSPARHAAACAPLSPQCSPSPCGSWRTGPGTSSGDEEKQDAGMGQRIREPPRPRAHCADHPLPTGCGSAFNNEPDSRVGKHKDKRPANTVFFFLWQTKKAPQKRRESAGNMRDITTPASGVGLPAPASSSHGTILRLEKWRGLPARRCADCRGPGHPVGCE